MNSSTIINSQIRFGLVSFAVVLFFFALNACTVKRVPVESGTIPKLAAPSPGAESFGKELFLKLRTDYDLVTGNPEHAKVVEVFNQLTKAAEVDHLPWHIYLFNGSEIIDIRAVHGNYIFVWTGVLEVVENDDEFAGLLAYELSHTLAHHTDPVEFTLASDVFFNVAELATTFGLMVASQGMVAISGSGWMKWAYVEVADLDPLDREYSDELEYEAAEVALVIISRTQYSPQALPNFWKRVAADESLNDKYERLSRSRPLRERAAMMEQLILKFSESNNRLAKKPIQ